MKRFKDGVTGVTKRILYKYVFFLLDKKIQLKHIQNIISILFEELFLDLKSFKKIKINNFAEIFLEKNPPKKYIPLNGVNFIDTEGLNSIKFYLFYNFFCILY